jgi:hypothetical protein
MSTLSARGGVLLLEGLRDLPPRQFLLCPRGARPVHQESLSTNLAAHIAYGIGDFAQNLHRGIGPFETKSFAERTGLPATCIPYRPAAGTRNST